MKKKNGVKPTVEQLKEQIDIVDVLEKYIGIDFKKNYNLSKKSIQMCCPFHDDSKPSFTVYRKTNTCVCWSNCNDNKPMDVIKVVQLARNVSFKEAMKILATDFGITSSKEARAAYQLKKKKRETTNRVIEKLEKELFGVIDQIFLIKTPEDLEKHGDLYHLKERIERKIGILKESTNS